VGLSEIFQIEINNEGCANRFPMRPTTAHSLG